MQVKFATIDGIRTRYLHEGKGEAVFLIHGIGLSGDAFFRNIDVLAERYTVIAPDLIGHGFTDAVDFKGAAPQIVMARHLVALADSLGLKSYTPVGSSFGGLVASLMYFQDPKRVRKIGLLGTASTFQNEDEHAKALRAAAANAVQAYAHPTLASCRRRLEGVVFDPASVPGEILLSQLTSYALPDRHSAYNAAIDGCIANLGDPAARVSKRLEDIAIPALAICGREDIRSDWRAHAAGVERMPNARLKIYEKCGHFSFFEHAGKFNADLAEFLAQHA